VIERTSIVAYVNELLRIHDYSDSSTNGLQVEGSELVNKIITSVSASVELFEKAVAAQAQMIIVHHGILWEKESRVVKGGLKKRLEILLANQMNLLAYHLPLDGHEELGNNAVAAGALHLRDLQRFADVGWMGNITPVPFDQFLDQVKGLYQSEPLTFAYGPHRVERVGICSGGAQRSIVEAIDRGLDVYVTGECSEATMHLAQEGGIHFIAAGHYATERPGIQALGTHLQKKFDLQVEYIDVPNPI